MALSSKKIIVGIVAIVLICIAVFALERERAGLVISDLEVGGTPATLYQMPDSNGPVVVVAHGFAGSRQMMQAYSLRLAQAGYRVVAFDFEGHGRNPTPMRGDVTSVDGTTALLVAETRKVIAGARELPNASQMAILGHSMATDIIVRASLAEARADAPLDAVVAISMFSEAVTKDAPKRLLVISGEWESYLRQAALDAVHLVDPQVDEGQLAQSGEVVRRAVVAPKVEHIGVLFSARAVDAALDWLDVTFDRNGAEPAGAMGLWVLVLLSGIVMGFYPLAGLLPKGPVTPRVSSSRFLLASLAPMLVVPLVLTQVYSNFLPVLVADYLMLHLALFGVMQLAVMRIWNTPRLSRLLPAVAALAFWGIVVFGLALDRYAASFWPTSARLPIIAVLCIGTIPFAVADSFATQAGRGLLWRRLLARLALFVSLGLAAVLDPAELTFVLIVLPVFLLFFLVHGLLGRWVGRRSGAAAAGLGLGLCLAWALGVSFPMFAQS